MACNDDFDSGKRLRRSVILYSAGQGMIGRYNAVPVRLKKRVGVDTTQKHGHLFIGRRLVLRFKFPHAGEPRIMTGEDNRTCDPVSKAVQDSSCLLDITAPYCLLKSPRGDIRIIFRCSLDRGVA